ncbi:hypothetical protein [Pseudomonas sp. TWP3-2]|uniref:hypothetical protein n=1 Tax=Pseudomonas sp. TWP3-2 TaxID=2804574 RepID=UPI003CF26077
MVEHLLPILRDRYPEFFSHAPLREIGCLPGWLGLLDELCGALTTYLKALPEVPQVRARQVTEKFGGLRFYYSGGDATCRELIARAEERSLAICEVCGGAGKLGGEDWLRVRCLDLVNWLPPSDCA